MKFVTFMYGNNESIGILSEDGTKVIPLEDIKSKYTGMDMLSYIKTFDENELKDLTEASKKLPGLDLSEVKIQAPIPEPNRVICIGKNYREHIREVAKAVNEKDYVPEKPVYFSKLVDRSPGQDGIIPYQGELTQKMDYEVELAIIIGKEGKDIPKEKVEEYIFGYTILNDISVRDIQRAHVQWLRGKSLDGSCPTGPCIVHKSTIEFPVEVDIKSLVNGELRQNSNTREFIYDIPHIISEFSKGITLKPGDIIATGTPSGVGIGFEPPKFLKPGDVVECVIEGIGTLRNRVE